MHTRLAPSPHPALRDKRTPCRLPPSDRFRRLHAVHGVCQALSFWVHATSGVPRWLPARWRRPLASYLLALLVNGVAIGLTVLLVTLAPALHQGGVLLLVGIVVVAITCGVGPCVFATGVDLLLLAGVVLVASLSGRQYPADWMDLVVVLVSGLGLSFLAGQSRWARRRAEALARSLRAAKASGDVERLRLRTLLEVLPMPVAMVDAQGRFLEYTPANKTRLGDAASWARELAEVPPYPGWRPDTGQPVARDDLPIVRALTNGESALNEELEFEVVDGQRKILLNSAVPIRDETGAIRGAVGVAQDITERKRLEEGLRQAEREAAARAAQLEAIFESIADGVTVTDHQGRVLHMNRAGRALLGLEREQDPRGWTLPQLEGLAGFAGYTPSGRRLADGDDPVPRVLQGEVLSKQQSTEIIVRTRAGRETWFNTTGAPIRDATGQLLGSVLVARDVTEQRRLEQHTRDTLDALLAMAQALVQGNEQQAEQGEQTLDPALLSGSDAALAGVAGVATRLAELTRRVLDCRSVSIVAVDAQTEVLTPITVVGHSKEVEQRWWAGWKREREREGQGQSHLRDVLPADAVAALHAGEVILPEHLPASFGCWYQLSEVCSPVLVPMRIGETLVGGLQIDGEDTSALGEADKTGQRTALVQAVARLGALVLERERLLRDRTQAQATELALRETQTQMEAFLATAAHDLRTPLTAAVGYLDLAAHQTEQLAAAVREADPALAPRVDAVRAHLDDAAEGTERLTRLLNLLFDTAVLRAGKLELRRAPCDLVALVREQVEALRVAVPARTIRLHVLVDGAPIPVEADADRLGQVVTNYMTNALKYSPPDQPVDVEVIARVQGSGRQARVAVCDQGPGIPPEEQAHVWERFHRVPGLEVQGAAHGGAAGGSLGLGLHICKAIVEAHGGRVGVESAFGKGSTFWFTLSLAGAPFAPPIAS